MTFRQMMVDRRFEWSAWCSGKVPPEGFERRVVATIGIFHHAVVSENTKSASGLTRRKSVARGGVAAGVQLEEGEGGGAGGGVKTRHWVVEEEDEVKVKK